MAFMYMFIVVVATGFLSYSILKLIDDSIKYYMIGLIVLIITSSAHFASNSTLAEVYNNKTEIKECEFLGDKYYALKDCD